MSLPLSPETARMFERLAAGPARMHELRTLTGLTVKQVENRLWPMLRDGAIAIRRVKTLHARGAEREFSLVAQDEGLPTVTDRRAQRRRPCMCCGKTFASEGPHNRMCYDCRRKAGDVSPFTPDL